MKRRHRAIGLALLCFAATLPEVLAEDSLDRRLRAQSPEATDCGRASDDSAARKTVVHCAVAQFEAGGPFRARFDNRCIDGVCSWGLFRDKRGAAVQVVPFDPKTCNPTNDSDPWCGTFGAAPCKNPKLQSKGKRLEVLCEGYSL